MVAQYGFPWEELALAQMDVTKAIEPAFQHMVRVLFRPFVFRKWIALGFIALIAYGGSVHGGGGGGGSPTPSSPDHRPDQQRQQESQSQTSHVRMFVPESVLGLSFAAPSRLRVSNSVQPQQPGLVGS